MANIRLNKTAEQKIYPDIGTYAVDSFGQFISDLPETPIYENTVVAGKIIAVSDKHVLVSIGCKSEGKIKIQEFENPSALQIGDETKAYVERVEDMDGNISLSRSKAIKQELWDKYVKLFETKATIEGEVKHVSKSGGGGVVEFEDTMRAFLPISHADMRAVENLSVLIGVKLGFRILSMDAKQNSIAVSRKLVLNELHAEARNEYVSQLKEGQIIEDGIVKSVTNYGVFIQIHESDKVGVVDGLLYVGDISWSKKKIHPSLLYKRRQKVRVKIIGVDKETGKISLGYKQLSPNPWQNASLEFPSGSIIEGKVSNVEEKGVFVELNSLIEGFIDNQEISWNKERPNLSSGQSVTVKILEVDADHQIIKLSMKRCQENPWQNLLTTHPLGTTIECTVMNLTDNYISVQINEPSFQNLKGFIRAKDISWEEDAKKNIKKYKPDDKIKAKILQINLERGNIYLGIKQLERDPFEEFLQTVNEGDITEATISKIEEDGVYVKVENEAEIFIKKDVNFGGLSNLLVGQTAKFKVAKKENYSVSLIII